MNHFLALHGASLIRLDCPRNRWRILQSKEFEYLCKDNPHPEEQAVRFASRRMGGKGPDCEGNQPKSFAKAINQKVLRRQSNEKLPRREAQSDAIYSSHPS